MPTKLTEDSAATDENASGSSNDGGDVVDGSPNAAIDDDDDDDQSLPEIDDLPPPIAQDEDGEDEPNAAAAASSNNCADGSSPITIIHTPHPHDVLSGRGGHTNHHPGNIRFRQLIESHKREYSNASRNEKSEIATRVVSLIKGLDPPGRFLKMKENSTRFDPTSGQRTNDWVEIGDDKACGKAMQALRENIIGDGDDNGDGCEPEKKRRKHAVKDIVDSKKKRPATAVVVHRALPRRKKVQAAVPSQEVNDSEEAKVKSSNHDKHKDANYIEAKEVKSSNHNKDKDGNNLNLDSKTIPKTKMQVDGCFTKILLEATAADEERKKNAVESTSTDGGGGDVLSKLWSKKESSKAPALPTTSNVKLIVIEGAIPLAQQLDEAIHHAKSSKASSKGCHAPKESPENDEHESQPQSQSTKSSSNRPHWQIRAKQLTDWSSTKSISQHFPPYQNKSLGYGHYIPPQYMLAQLSCPLIKAHAVSRWHRFSQEEQTILRSQFVELERYEKARRKENRKIMKKLVSEERKRRGDERRNRYKREKRARERMAKEANKSVDYDDGGKVVVNDNEDDDKKDCAVESALRKEVNKQDEEGAAAGNSNATKPAAQVEQRAQQSSTVEDDPTSLLKLVVETQTKDILLSSTAESSIIDPEALAFKGLLSAICTNCLTHKTTSVDHIDKIVARYKPRYPQLTAELIEGEIINLRLAQAAAAEKDKDGATTTGQQRQRRRGGRPANNKRPRDDLIAITEEDLERYAGTEGDTILMQDLFDAMPEETFNSGRYQVLENHVNLYEIGDLDGLSYGTFNDWVKGRRKKKGLDLEHKRAMISFIKRMNEEAGSRKRAKQQNDDDDDDAQLHIRPEQLKPKRICTIEGCTNQGGTKGRCYKHGGRKPCKVKGCPNSIIQGGVCLAHGAQPKSRPLCSAEGCTNKMAGRNEAGEQVCLRHGAQNTKTRTCSAEGCTNKVICRGLCKRHGALGPPKICIVHDCTRIVYNKGLCAAHGPKPPRLCNHPDGCTNQSSRRGLCRRHGGFNICSVEECTNKVVCKGLCKLHGGRNHLKKCSVDGCNKISYIKGICRMHSPKPLCKYPGGCTKQIWRKGMCMRHGRESGVLQEEEEEEQERQQQLHEDEGWGDDDYCHPVADA